MPIFNFLTSEKRQCHVTICNDLCQQALDDPNFMSQVKRVVSIWPQPRNQTAVFFKWKTRKDNGNMQVSCPGQHNLTLQPKYSPNLALCVLFPKMKSVILVLAVDLIQIHGKIESTHHIPVVTKMYVPMLIKECNLQYFMKIIACTCYIALLCNSPFCTTVTGSKIFDCIW